MPANWRGVLYCLLGVAGATAWSRAAVQAAWTHMEANEALPEPLDMVFDVDCYQNEDQYCIEYCLYYCAIPQAAAGGSDWAAACVAQLPPVCEVGLGGARFLRVPGAASGAVWSQADEATVEPGDARDIKLHLTVDALRDALANTDVEWTDVFVGISPSLTFKPQIVDPGAKQDEIDEGVYTNNTCGARQANVGAFSVHFDALATDGSTQTFVGGREQRGLQDGMFPAKMGWRVIQQYAGHYETELVKNLYFIPLTPQLVINDLNAPYYDQNDQVTFILNTMRGCVEDFQANGGYNFLFAWRKTLKGTNYAAMGNTWGARPPRLDTECAAVSTCDKCLAKTGCSWCMTPAGQECVVECSNGYYQPLQCSAAPAAFSVTTVAILAAAWAQ